MASKGTGKAIARLVIATLGLAAVVFGTAGTVRWWQGWAFGVAYAVILVALTAWVFLPSPELVEERAKAGAKAQGWDRLLVPVLGLALPLTVLLSGFDHRFGWSAPMPVGASLGALVVMLVGNLLTMWAMKVNPFFSSHVRIQDDRGHQVVGEGPYGVVRHPGYTGSLLYNLAIPVLLGSRLAFGVGVAFTVLLVVRTALEDRMLRQELAGYGDYAERVRYRLIPRLW